MKILQYYLACLSHASYMIIDEKTKTAVVVDINIPLLRRRTRPGNDPHRNRCGHAAIRQRDHEIPLGSRIQAHVR